MSERLFAGIYVDADLTPRIVSALRQRNYECQSALEDGLREATFGDGRRDARRRSLPV
jgi:hypothetical protein